MATTTNWRKISKGYYHNLNLGVEAYRTMTGWYVRNNRTGQYSGPHTTLKAAQAAAYDVL